jgi:prophage DNA circulation protein
MKQSFWNAAEDFIAAVPAMISIQRGKLGSLFDDKDYPDEGTLRAKFKFDIDLAPLATENDFRVDLSEDELVKIRQQYASSTDAKISDAMKEVWDRLFAAVKTMVERLSDPDAIFRQSLVGNLQDLVQVLPSLNISGDQRLTEMSEAVEVLLCGYDPKDLRKDKVQREEAAQNAKDILNTMAGYMGIPATQVSDDEHEEAKAQEEREAA